MPLAKRDKRTIRLFKDGNLSLDIDDLVIRLNEVCHNVQFMTGSSKVELATPLSRKLSFDQFSKTFLNESKHDYLTVVLSNKEFDDNYFFWQKDKVAIISFYGWNYVTKLPITNGVVFFIAELFSLEIDSSYRHQTNTGCVYDFRGDKRGIDLALRAGFICSTCLSRIGTCRLSPWQNKLISDVRSLLNDISSASKWNTEITTYWKEASNKDQPGDPILASPDFTPVHNPDRTVEITTRELRILNYLYTSLSNVESDSEKKGKVFEEFSKHFFGQIRGWKLLEQDANLGDCEIDLIYDISAGPRNLQERLGNHIYVECKFRTEKSDSRDLSQFMVDLRTRDLKGGIFFSMAGITGYNPEKWRVLDAAYKRILEVCRMDKIYVLPIVRQDIEIVKNGRNLVDHLIDLHNRFVRI